MIDFLRITEAIFYEWTSMWPKHLIKTIKKMGTANVQLSVKDMNGSGISSRFGVGVET